MIKWVLATILGAVLGLGGYLYWHLGGWRPVEIAEQDKAAFKVISKEHIGAYHKIVPVIEEVEKWARANGLACAQSFGEYFDNPDVMEEARLRSRGGCLVGDSESALIRADLQWPEGVQLSELPARHYVSATFAGSPGIGPMKVYPKVFSYIEEHHLQLSGATMEIYEIHDSKDPQEKVARNMVTTYLFPVERAK